MFCFGNFWSGEKNKSSNGATVKPGRFATGALNCAATFRLFRIKGRALRAAARLSNMATV
jgi:hypothetical protein